jgi:hypothetical protein
MMRIVTRPDFDGVVCAALLKDVLTIEDGILWVEPNDMQQRKVEVLPGDVIANLAFHPVCELWFDHHLSNRREGVHPGLFEIAPSAAGLIFRHYQTQFTRDYSDMVTQTDRIDSAQLSLEEVLHPERYPYVCLSMTISGGEAQDEAYWNHLVALLGRQPLEDVMADAQVHDRCDWVKRDNNHYKELLKFYTRSSGGGVVVTDFRTLAVAPNGNRFLIFSLFPEAKVQIKVRYHKEDLDKVIISVSHSIFNRGCPVNIGQLMSCFGGGGHFGAGSCSVSSAGAQSVLAEITTVLTKSSG